MIIRRIILLLGLASIAVPALTKETFTGDDREKFAKLNKPGLSTKKVDKILNSIDHPESFKIGKLSVLEIWRIFNNAFIYVWLCQDTALARREEYVKELKSVTSVYNFANDRNMEMRRRCLKKFPRIMKGNEQLQELNVEGLEDERIGRILYSIEDKGNVQIGHVSVQTIVDLPRLFEHLGWPNDVPDKYCQRGQILKFLRSDKSSSDLNLVLNVYKFLFASSTDKLKSDCLQKVERVFRDNQLITRLDDDSITSQEAKNLLNSIEDKDNVKFGSVSVRTMLDRDSKSLSAEDCLYDAFFEHRNYWLQLRETGVSGVTKFADAQYNRLPSFCVVNIEQIFNDSMDKLNGISKKDLELLAGQMQALDPSRSAIAFAKVRPACPEIIKPFKLISTICTEFRIFPVALPTGCNNILNEGKWATVHRFCKRY